MHDHGNVINFAEKHFTVIEAANILQIFIHINREIYLIYRSSRSKVFCKMCFSQVFPVNFAKFLRTPFIMEHLWWLLLYLVSFPFLLDVIGIYKFSLSIRCNFYHFLTCKQQLYVVALTNCDLIISK